MPGKVAKIGTFSDWIGLFNDWRKDIGVNTDDIEAFQFDTLYGSVDTDDIEFGHYKGKRKWENLRQIPTQQMRDALMNMIVYQGDTEFASVEQQRNLLENAPTDWDRRAITRVMIEEMRHGWQMCALLVDHFGYSGKVEAQKMLERRAFENKRLLGAFNVDVDNWMDFFTYTDFVDRDGKFQLQMLKYSAFAPLGRSMSYMGEDEAALLRLWREKRGEIEPEDLSGSLIVQLGTVTEDLNRHWYQKQSGHEVTHVQRWVVHPVHKWMGATLDGRVEAIGAVFEAKFMRNGLPFYLDCVRNG